MKLHQKAFLLVELSNADSLWDHELVSLALSEYGLSGNYWINAQRAALEELAAAGLVNRIAERLDDGHHVGNGKILFKYKLSEFGRNRMRDTGLLQEGKSK